MSKDKETRKISIEGKRLKELVESEGWQIAKKKLMDKLMDAGSVMNFDSKLDPQKAVIEIAAKKMAIEMVYEWITRDVYGTVEQHKSNSKEIFNEMKEDYIIRMDELEETSDESTS